MKIACFSVAAIDYFPESGQYFAGGNALNQAIHLARLGHATAFFGAVGDDAAGRHILALLKKAGVHCGHCIPLPGATASNQIVNDATGERFGVEGAWKNGVYGNYRFDAITWQALEDYEVWSTNSFDPHFEQTLHCRQFSSKSHSLCVDYLHLPDPTVMETSLSRVDIAYAGGTVSMIPFMEKMALLHPHKVLVLTLGAEGSIAFQKHRRWEQPALPVEKVIDTTGCGDAFQAAFSATYLTTRSVVTALQAGARQGQQTTTHLGAQPEPLQD